MLSLPAVHPPKHRRTAAAGVKHNTSTAQHHVRSYTIRGHDSILSVQCAHTTCVLWIHFRSFFVRKTFGRIKIVVWDQTYASATRSIGSTCCLETRGSLVQFAFPWWSTRRIRVLWQMPVKYHDWRQRLLRHHFLRYRWMIYWFDFVDFGEYVD